MEHDASSEDSLHADQDDRILEIVDLNKSFGGLAAVQHLNIYVDTGSITSLIGPNGAGKSTVFNLISGLYKPDKRRTRVTKRSAGWSLRDLAASVRTPFAGAIMFEGRDIAGHSPDWVQKRGIARTFQNQRLFANLSVLDNVLIGYHSRLKAGLVGDVIKPPWVRNEEQEAQRASMEALAVFGNRLTPQANRRCTDLAYADRRLLELARAIVSEPRLLLLDEPTAGMNPTETVQFMGYVRAIRERGTTVLLIEHNLSVVMGISERVVVLDYGTKIAEGKPEDVRNDERVIEAYLGRRATRARA